MYRGRKRYQSGNSATTVTVPAGAILTQIIAHTSGAAGSITIFGGIYADSGNDTLAVVATGTHSHWDFDDDPQYQSKNNSTTPGSQNIVIAGAAIDEWYVEYLVPSSGAAH
jgi:hypothetical protein